MKIEWPTVALIAMTYAVWAFAGALVWPVNPVLALLMLTLCTAMHSSLVHENLHGHPTRKRRVNEALVAVNLGLLYPYRRYRESHLRHHNDVRLTDPFEDPETYYRAAWMHRTMPPWLRGLLAANNTMLGRMVLGPWLGSAAFLWQELHAVVNNAPGVRRAWLMNIVGCVPVIVALIHWGIPVWLYVVTAIWGAQSLIAIRTYAEHQWHERPDGRTIIVERSPLSLLFLNNNLHIVHHKLPRAPWYDLPRLYHQRRPEWHAINDGYVYPNYRALWRDHALHAKEPVEHPVLHRSRAP